MRERRQEDAREGKLQGMHADTELNSQSVTRSIDYVVY